MQCEFFQWLDPPIVKEQSCASDGKDIARVFSKLKWMEEYLESMVKHQKKIDEEMKEQLEKVVEQTKKMESEMQSMNAQLRSQQKKEYKLKAFCFVLLVIWLGLLWS